MWRSISRGSLYKRPSRVVCARSEYDDDDDDYDDDDDDYDDGDDEFLWKEVDEQGP